MKPDEIRLLCAVALDSVKDILPAMGFQQAHEWVHEYGEWGLAIECVIDWIGDDDLPINDRQFNAIEKAMDAMNWKDSPRMEWLRKYKLAQ